MDVSQILDLMATLSIGLDERSQADTDVFMQYINLAYFEILQTTLSQNPFATIINTTLNCNDGECDPIPNSSNPELPVIFIPKVVYDVVTNLPISGSTLDEILQKDPGLTNTDNVAQSWYLSGGIINIYPAITSLVSDSAGIGIRYIGQPESLTEDSTSADILIPFMYQQLLADGASYYLFQSETGFKDQTKMQASMMRWEEGKRKLFAYMKNISGKKHFSTFSCV